MRPCRIPRIRDSQRILALDQFDFSQLRGPGPDDPVADAVQRLMADQMSGQARPRADTFFDLFPTGAPFRFRRDLEFPLYRYTQRTYANDFFERGRIRLNTLLTYTESELFNAAVGDDREGRVTFQRSWYNPIANEDDVLKVEVSVQNQWVLCASGVRDDARMLEEFEANSCYSIDSIEFFEILNREIGARSASGVVDKIVYLDSDYIDLDAVRPGQPRFAGFYKQSRYAYQSEVRAVWETPGAPVLYDFSATSEEEVGSVLAAHVAQERRRMSPLMLEVSEAARHCTLLF